MKNITSLALAGALVCSAASAAVTDPVGYYTYSAPTGGNLCVPSFVNSAAFSGALTGVTGSFQLDVAPGSLVDGAFDEGSTYATHYVEITSGPNAGVVIDISGNTTDAITVSDDLSALSLVGDESIVVRSHVTLGALFPDSELGAFTTSATFYFLDGSSATYLFNGTIWTTDGFTPDGEDVPVMPGTGFVLTVSGAPLSLTVTGEVKSTPTVVQLASGNAVNVVGPTNPLAGTAVSVNDVGFDGLAAFADGVTRYTEDGALGIAASYIVSGSGDLTTDGFTPTTDTIGATNGVVISSPAGGSAVVSPEFTVAP